MWAARKNAETGDRPVAHGLSRYLMTNHKRPANDNGRNLRRTIRQALAMSGVALAGAIGLVVALLSE